MSTVFSVIILEYKKVSLDYDRIICYSAMYYTTHKEILMTYNYSVLPGFDNTLFASNSTIMEIFTESIELLKKFPEIGVAIREDQDKIAREKKKVREATKQFQIAKTEELTNIELPVPVPIEPKLKQGRPRMSVELVLFFMFLRGKWDSLSDFNASERMTDSISIQYILRSNGLKTPGATTLRENINALSNSTRFLILQAQAMMIIEKGLDDFQTVLVDSTAVAGNTAWPTDISILLKLLKRLSKCFQKLQELGLPEFNDGWTTERLIRLEKHLKFINMQAGKRGIKGKVKTRYRQFLTIAQNLLVHYVHEQKRFTSYWEDAELSPLYTMALDRIWGKIDDDIGDASYVLYYADLRIEKGVKLPSTQKILSISDCSAGYIQKGQREAVIGYKPQIARSGNGFVCGLVVPEGNLADARMLKPVMDQVFCVTGVIPSMLSVDDGYASKENVNDLFDAGINTVSISGAKGRKLLTEELWNAENYIEARNKRSAVESGMFTLKHNHGFGQLRRRGIEHVTAELLEKVLTYNLLRMIKKEKEAKEEFDEFKKVA